MRTRRGATPGGAGRRSLGAAAVVVAACAAVVLLSACGSTVEEARSPSTSAPSTTTFVPPTSSSMLLPQTSPSTTPTTPAPPATVRPPAPHIADDVRALLAQLQVAPEARSDTYDRDDWPHWSTQPDGCSTRERVLIDESRSVPQVDAFGCTVLVGDWFSIYDGEVTEDPGDLDIDHVVALAEAHRSGGWAWDEARREAFANDLGFDGSLIAVSAASNRSKSDKDPARWQPSRDAAWCDYATDWVQVKVRWGLTADQAEVDALRNMLRRCTDPVSTATL